MNWFKKATVIMNPLDLNWDKISLELKEEFEEKGEPDRVPSAKEIQERLMQKYWHSTDVIEHQNPLTENE